ncbi:MAG: D-alanyl-D-alanine carboxypeptidase family protein [Candidatus Absconditabacterales bacterium]
MTTKIKQHFNLYTIAISFIIVFVFGIITFVFFQGQVSASKEDIKNVLEYKLDCQLQKEIINESLSQNDLLNNIFLPSYDNQFKKKSEFDLESDSSIQKYLSKKTPFNNQDYVPEDLTSINSNFTFNDSSKFFLRQEAGIQFADLAWHFWNEFKGDKLYIVSAYRSREFQNYLLQKGCDISKCAKAGTSEHQAGLAIDINVIMKNGKNVGLEKQNKYYSRLIQNANKFGFHNTYQKGIEIDGQIAEGRHRRYLGTGLANILSQKNLTFAEFFKQMNN